MRSASMTKRTCTVRLHGELFLPDRTLASHAHPRCLEFVVVVNFFIDTHHDQRTLCAEASLVSILL